MQAYTIRAVFWSHKLNKSGTGPIMIAVTLSRKVRYFKTPFRIEPGQWEDNKVVHHGNATLINRAIRGQITEIEGEILGRAADGEVITSRNLKKTKLVNVFEFAKEVQKNLPA